MLQESESILSEKKPLRSNTKNEMGMGSKVLVEGSRCLAMLREKVTEVDDQVLG